MSARGIGLGCLALAATLVAGCSPDPAARLRALQLESSQLTAAREANAAFLKAADDYQAELRGPADGTFSLYWTPAALEKAASQVLPMRLDAKSFHRQLEGTIIVERLAAMRFAPGNRLTATAFMKGERIRFTGSVPAMFKNQVVQFQQGVAEGVNVNVEVSLTLGGGRLRAQAQALKATLRKNSSAQSEQMLVDEINQRALRSPFMFELALPESKLQPRRALLTGNHLVVAYGP